MSKREREAELVARVREFVFFHLGSDARVSIAPSASGLEIDIEHQRVSPMRLEFPAGELESLAADSSGLEDRLLSELTLHRRSRGETS